MKIFFIADFFVDKLFAGGGEKSNDEFINQCRKLNNEVITKESYYVTLEEIKKMNEDGYRFIIANFLLLHTEVLNYITKNCKYIIIEHDHKYLESRNPGLYRNFIAPKSDIRFIEFYKNSIKIICQSNLHKEIMQKNLELDNIMTINGNFWSDDELKYIEENRELIKKSSLCCIIDYSGNLSKGTDLAIQYCISNKLPYKLINVMPFRFYIDEISRHHTFVFIPRTPETFSRIIVEAKMLGTNIKTIKKLIGACNEEWWDKYSSKELIEYFLYNKENFTKIILQSFNE